MKEITTTTVTTEVIRRAPRKKTIAKAEHALVDGQIVVTETYAPVQLGNAKGDGYGISRIGLAEAKKKLRQGLTNELLPTTTVDQFSLAASLQHLTIIRDGISAMATRPGLRLLDRDNRERLMIIAVQLNEFIPILRDIMVNQVNLFANKQFSVL